MPSSARVILLFILSCKRFRFSPSNERSFSLWYKWSKPVAYRPDFSITPEFKSLMANSLSSYPHPENELSKPFTLR